MDKIWFARSLFEGTFDFSQLLPWPAAENQADAEGEAFLRRLQTFVEEKLDGDEIDHAGRIPDFIFEGLRKLGVFGMTIPREYGGLGFSEAIAVRALSIISSRCAATGDLLATHLDIGAGPLKLYGSEEQKRKYLPQIAAGRIAAFALTEPGVGSDPSDVKTTATLSEDGRHYVLNGTKQWISNAPIAEIFMVMARTPEREVGGKPRYHTAFVLEAGTPGFELKTHCHFMGLRGMQNGVLSFKDVRIPRENVVWEEGLGLKMVVMTLGSGRLSVSADCMSKLKTLLRGVRVWAGQRVQWGKPIGKHELVSHSLEEMACSIFAGDAAVQLLAAMMQSHRFDVRMEGAMLKMWCAETGWRMADAALQIRGGRGFETAASQKARGETPLPVERFLRDMRIQRIQEGTSEIMQVYVATSALMQRTAGAGASSGSQNFSEFGPLESHLRAIESLSGTLSATVSRLQSERGEALLDQQGILKRLAFIGCELFVMAASCGRAWAENRNREEALRLTDGFCRSSRRRIDQLLKDIDDNEDPFRFDLGQEVLSGRHSWIEKDIAAAEARS